MSTVAPPPAGSPTGSPAASGADDEFLVSATGIKVHFPITRGIIFDKTIGYVYAVDGVDLAIRRGETEIVQVRGPGRESPTDTYLNIQAAASPDAHGYAVVNKTLAAGEHRIDVRAFDRWRGEVTASTHYSLLDYVPPQPQGELQPRP